MPTNSFRLFVVSLHDDRMGDRQPFNEAQPRPVKEEIPEGERKNKRQKHKIVKPGTIDYCAQAEADASASAGAGEAFVFGKKIAEDDDIEASTVVGHAIRWTKADHIGTVTRLWFEAGPTSDDGVVVDLSGRTEDLELKGRATLHHYRASLITLDDAHYALLAVEARGARCPKDQLVRALFEVSDQPWRLRVHNGAAEKAAVLDYIERADINAVTFTEYGFAKDGQRTPPQRKKLRVAEFTGHLDEVKDAVRGWIKAKWSGGGAAAAAELKSLVVTEEVDIPFHDVAVEFDDDQQQRTYKPTSDFNRFSYFLGKEIVADSDFFDGCEQAAKDLLSEVQGIVGEED